MDSELIQALCHFLRFTRKATLLKQDNQKSRQSGSLNVDSE